MPFCHVRPFSLRSSTLTNPRCPCPLTSTVEVMDPQSKFHGLVVDVGGRVVPWEAVLSSHLLGFQIEDPWDEWAKPLRRPFS